MSDALTDLARSEEISYRYDNLLDAEKTFLAKPTKENLELIYQKCEKLSQCFSGYWGEDVQMIANTVLNYYKQQFGKKKKYVIGAKEIGAFLGRIRKTERIPHLADLITKSQGFVRKDEKYYKKYKENYQYIMDHLTLLQNSRLESKSVEEDLEDILRESKIIDIFPLPMKSE